MWSQPLERKALSDGTVKNATLEMRRWTYDLERAPAPARAAQVPTRRASRVYPVKADVEGAQR